MIHYQLRCSESHEFDGWFPSGAAFEAQAERGLLECPMCGDHTIERALMTPSVPRKGRDLVVPNATPPETPQVEPEVIPPPRAISGEAMPAQVRALLQRLRAEVERNCDNVGDQFAQEARRMHRGDGERRAIYGDTTPDEAEALAEEGIDIARIPWVPRADG